jgi:hypothetical protein
VSQAAVARRLSHPLAPALDVLDVIMSGSTGSLADFGGEIEPATSFGDILAEAFDRGMAPANGI